MRSKHNIEASSGEMHKRGQIVEMVMNNTQSFTSCFEIMTGSLFFVNVYMYFEICSLGCDIIIIIISPFVRKNMISSSMIWKKRKKRSFLSLNNNYIRIILRKNTEYVCHCEREQSPISKTDVRFSKFVHWRPIFCQLNVAYLATNWWFC